MDTSFLDVLRPLYILSSIFCIRKYSVHDGIVSTINPKGILITFAAHSILLCLFYVTFQNSTFNELSLKLYYLVIFGQHVFSFIIISCNNIRLSKLYVALINSLQKIYNFERNQLSSKSLKRKLNIGCGILMYLYIGVIIPKVVFDPYWNWARALFLALTIIIDLELLFIIFVIRLLALKFKTWSKVISKYLSQQKNTNCHTNFINTDTDSRLSNNEAKNISKNEEDDIIEEYQEIDVHNIDEPKELFEVYDQLVNSTNLMKSAFQFTIFFHAFTVFSQSLVYIGVLILWVKLARHDLHLEKSVLISHSAGIITWVTKSLVLQTLLGTAMEGLYTGVRASRTAASVIVGRQHDLATTRSAKNALRLSSSRPCRYKAVGALPIDAALPLRLAALVGSYTIVLLQFALS